MKAQAGSPGRASAAAAQHNAHSLRTPKHEGLFRYGRRCGRHRSQPALTHLVHHRSIDRSARPRNVDARCKGAGESAASARRACGLGVSPGLVPEPLDGADVEGCLAATGEDGGPKCPIVSRTSRTGLLNTSLASFWTANAQRFDHIGHRKRPRRRERRRRRASLLRSDGCSRSSANDGDGRSMRQTRPSSFCSLNDVSTRALALLIW
jgi:hypothetical protein